MSDTFQQGIDFLLKIGVINPEVLQKLGQDVTAIEKSNLNVQERRNALSKITSELEEKVAASQGKQKEDSLQILENFKALIALIGNNGSKGALTGIFSVALDQLQAKLIQVQNTFLTQDKVLADAEKRFTDLRDVSSRLAEQFDKNIKLNNSTLEGFINLDEAIKQQITNTELDARKFGELNAQLQAFNQINKVTKFQNQDLVLSGDLGQLKELIRLAELYRLSAKNLDAEQQRGVNDIIALLKEEFKARTATTDQIEAKLQKEQESLNKEIQAREKETLAEIKDRERLADLEQKLRDEELNRIDRERAKNLEAIAAVEAARKKAAEAALQSGAVSAAKTVAVDAKNISVNQGSLNSNAVVLLNQELQGLANTIDQVDAKFKKDELTIDEVKGRQVDLRNAVAQLRIDFDRIPASTKGYDQLKKNFTEIEKSIGKIGETTANTESLFGKLGLAGTVAFGNLISQAVLQAKNKLTEFINEAKETAKELAKYEAEQERVSFVTGVSRENIAGLTAGFKFYDKGIREVEASISEYAKSAFNAFNGNKEATAAFNSLSINVRNSSNELRDTNDLLEELSNKLRILPATAQRTAALSILGGENKRDIAGVIAQLDKFKQLAAENNLILTGESKKAAEAYKESLTNLDLATQGLNLNLGVKLSKTLTEINDFFTQLAKGAQNNDALARSLGDLIELTNVLAAATAIVAAGIGVVGVGIVELAKGVATLAEGFAGGLRELVGFKTAAEETKTTLNELNKVAIEAGATNKFIADSNAVIINGNRELADTYKEIEQAIQRADSAVKELNKDTKEQIRDAQVELEQRLANIEELTRANAKDANGKPIKPLTEEQGKQLSAQAKIDEAEKEVDIERNKAEKIAKIEKDLRTEIEQNERELSNLKLQLGLQGIELNKTLNNVIKAEDQVKAKTLVDQVKAASRELGELQSLQAQKEIELSKATTASEKAALMEQLEIGKKNIANVSGIIDKTRKEIDGLTSTRSDELRTLLTQNIVLETAVANSVVDINRKKNDKLKELESERKDATIKQGEAERKERKLTGDEEDREDKEREKKRKEADNAERERQARQAQEFKAAQDVITGYLKDALDRRQKLSVDDLNKILESTKILEKVAPEVQQKIRDKIKEILKDQEVDQVEYVQFVIDLKKIELQGKLNGIEQDLKNVKQGSAEERKLLEDQAKFKRELDETNASESFLLAKAGREKASQELSIEEAEFEKFKEQSARNLSLILEKYKEAGVAGVDIARKELSAYEDNVKGQIALLDKRISQGLVEKGRTADIINLERERTKLANQLNDLEALRTGKITAEQFQKRQSFNLEQDINSEIQKGVDLTQQQIDSVKKLNDELAKQASQRNQPAFGAGDSFSFDPKKATKDDLQNAKEFIKQLEKEAEDIKEAAGAFGESFASVIEAKLALAQQIEGKVREAEARLDAEAKKAADDAAREREQKLADNLIEIVKKYQADLLKIVQDFREKKRGILTQELEENVQHQKDLTSLETKKNQDLAQIDKEEHDANIKREQDELAEKLKLQKEFFFQRRALDRDLQKQADEDERSFLLNRGDLRKQISDLETQAAAGKTEAERKKAEEDLAKLKDKLKKLEEDETKRKELEAKKRNEIAKAEAEAAEIAKTDPERAKRVLEARKKAIDEEFDLEKQFQQDLAQLEADGDTEGIERLKQLYEDRKKIIAEQSDDEIKQINIELDLKKQARDKELADQKASYDDRRKQINSQYETDKQDLINAYNDRIAALKIQFDKEKAAFKDHIDELKAGTIDALKAIGIEIDSTGNAIDKFFDAITPKGKTLKSIFDNIRDAIREIAQAVGGNSGSAGDGGGGGNGGAGSGGGSGDGSGGGSGGGSSDGGGTGNDGTGGGAGGGGQTGNDGGAGGGAGNTTGGLSKKQKNEIVVKGYAGAFLKGRKSGKTINLINLMQKRGREFVKDKYITNNQARFITGRALQTNDPAEFEKFVRFGLDNKNPFGALRFSPTQAKNRLKYLFGLYKKHQIPKEGVRAAVDEFYLSGSLDADTIKALYEYVDHGFSATTDDKNFTVSLDSIFKEAKQGDGPSGGGGNGTGQGGDGSGGADLGDNSDFDNGDSNGDTTGGATGADDSSPSARGGDSTSNLTNGDQFTSNLSSSSQSGKLDAGSFKQPDFSNGQPITGNPPSDKPAGVGFDLPSIPTDPLLAFHFPQLTGDPEVDLALLLNKFLITNSPNFANENLPGEPQVYVKAANDYIQNLVKAGKISKEDGEELAKFFTGPKVHGSLGDFKTLLNRALHSKAKKATPIEKGSVSIGGVIDKGAKITNSSDIDGDINPLGGIGPTSGGNNDLRTGSGGNDVGSGNPSDNHESGGDQNETDKSVEEIINGLYKRYIAGKITLDQAIAKLTDLKNQGKIGPKKLEKLIDLFKSATPNLIPSLGSIDTTGLGIDQNLRTGDQDKEGGGNNGGTGGVGSTKSIERVKLGKFGVSGANFDGTPVLSNTATKTEVNVQVDIGTLVAVDKNAADKFKQEIIRDTERSIDQKVANIIGPSGFRRT
jgi:hypothetical protein